MEVGENEDDQNCYGPAVHNRAGNGHTMPSSLAATSHWDSRGSLFEIDHGAVQAMLRETNIAQKQEALAAGGLKTTNVFSVAVSLTFRDEDTNETHTYTETFPWTTNSGLKSLGSRKGEDPPDDAGRYERMLELAQQFWAEEKLNHQRADGGDRLLPEDLEEPGFAQTYAHSETDMASDPRLDEALLRAVGDATDNARRDLQRCTLVRATLNGDSFPNTVCMHGACRPAIELMRAKLAALLPYVSDGDDDDVKVSSMAGAGTVTTSAHFIQAGQNPRLRYLGAEDTVPPTTGGGQNVEVYPDGRMKSGDEAAYLGDEADMVSPAEAMENVEEIADWAANPEQQRLLNVVRATSFDKLPALAKHHKEALNGIYASAHKKKSKRKVPPSLGPTVLHRVKELLSAGEIGAAEKSDGEKEKGSDD